MSKQVWMSNLGEGKGAGLTAPRPFVCVGLGIWEGRPTGTGEAGLESLSPYSPLPAVPASGPPAT